MNRFLAFASAVLLTALTVSATGLAQTGDWLRFTLEPSRSGGALHASFRDSSASFRHARGDGAQWSIDVPADQLLGLEAAEFRSAGSRPLHFSISHEAGRLDCAGQGGNSRASGNCSFASDPAFLRALAIRGVGTPDREQQFELMAVDAHTALLTALAQAHYQVPTVEHFLELTAVGVTPAYIDALARQGFRPGSLDELVQFRALDITPQFIASFQRAGYRDLKADELVQLRALDITPDYIASFARVGYANLPVDQLVQLKALDVTPDYIQSVIASGLVSRPTVDKLVELKALSGDRRNNRRN
jgi:hypothetical protein